MLSWKRVAAAFILALGVVAAGSARAACVQFQETRFDGAYLINSCPVDMNAAYAVTGDEDWAPGTSPLTRVSVVANSRKLLWTYGDRPMAGKYKIKVFSCIAPTSLVYQLGGRPTCQISFADAG